MVSKMPCIANGYPYLDSSFACALVKTTLPTMESAIITFDPFQRPRANGWVRTPCFDTLDLLFRGWV